MNGKQPYSEKLNAAQQRQAAPCSMEQLKRSLETLGKHIGRDAFQSPEKEKDLLVGQVTTLSDERARTRRETDHILHSIKQRFDLLLDQLDRWQLEATECSQAALGELERRFEELGGRIDARSSAAAAKSAVIMEAIDARFDELAHRLESRTQAPDPAIAYLAARSEDTALRLESRSAQSGVDPEIIRNLETQVSALSQHLSQPGHAPLEFGDGASSVSDIEHTLADRLGSVFESAASSLPGLEPAHTAASHWVPSIAANDDMRADAPMGAQAAEEWDIEPTERSQAPSRSMLSRLARVFSKKKRVDPSITDPFAHSWGNAKTSAVDLEHPFQCRLTNRRPGSGTTDDLDEVTRWVREERRHPVKSSDAGTNSDSLATARRAA